jgi:hypothetical protein
MRIRLTVERSGDLEIEADVHVDIAVKDLLHLSESAAKSAVVMLGDLLMMKRFDLHMSDLHKSATIAKMEPRRE